jgi:CBS-domain-containing membrane protein
MAFYKKDNQMKILLQESDYAFSIMVENGGATQTDFAEFTSNNFIRSFRHIMQKPDLSRAQLASMLRNAERRKRRRDNDMNWADFMSQTVHNTANSNISTIN